MKAEHRHELKTNELAEWIANFPQWVKENLRMIIYLSVVVVLVLGSYFWHRYQKDVAGVREKLQFTSLLNKLSQSNLQVLRAQSEGVDYSFTLIPIADELGNFARNTKNEQISALAFIKQAETLRTELHYRMGVLDKQNATDQINRAKSAYNEAVKKAGNNPSLKALAKYGLGLCEEELGNFDQAKQIYKEITEETSFQGTAAVASAEHRLKVMDDYKEKITFKAPKKKETAEPFSIVPDETDLSAQIPETPNSPNSQ